MKELEISAKTVEEAINLALEKLGTGREEVEVDILSEGSHGILGIGAEEAKVRVRLLKPTPSETGSLASQESDVVSFTRNVLETILEKLGLTASVVLKTEPIIQEAERTPPPVVFDIEGEDLGILIGRRGQTLACVQFITRLIVAQEMKAPTPTIVVDVGGYKQRRYQTLKSLAQHLAEQVAASGSPLTLEPMPAYERRIIHLTLTDHPDVTTESTGFGEARKVVILPRGQNASAIS
jgi:spoIIIJ-associated protein